MMASFIMVLNDLLPATAVFIEKQSVRLQRLFVLLGSSIKVRPCRRARYQVPGGPQILFVGFRREKHQLEVCKSSKKFD